MQAQRPTFMGSVPRVFEKVYNRILTQAEAGGGVRYALFRWAVGVGRRMSKCRQADQEPGLTLRIQFRVADRLVFSKIKALFGGRLRFLVSGGAPLAAAIAEFFHACDMLILEGWGMTETTAVGTINQPTAYRFGSVGRASPGMEVAVADDGELLIRGPAVMQGYHGLSEKTADALRDGGMHTGDIGEIDADGFVRITGRKKDLIITAGGKNIAPARFQNALKARSSVVGQVLMHGDRRPFCVAIVTLDPDAAMAWAAGEGIEETELAALSRHPRVLAQVQADVDAVNGTLPSYETVKKVHVSEQDWTVENGFLTPSMKVRRAVVEERYGAVLSEFYAGTVRQTPS